MTLTLKGAGYGPLYVFCAVDDGGLLIAEGYYSDTPIPKSAKLTDGTTSISVPFALQQGLFFKHDDEIGHKLDGPLFLLREKHDH